jgi:hypothetical protein
MKPAADPAQVLLELQNQTDPHQAWGSREVIIVLLAIALVVGILFLWAAYVRKPKRRRSSSNEIVASPILKKSRRPRRRSRKIKHRNPTLSETGGLPPRKQECVVPHSR